MNTVTFSVASRDIVNQRAIAAFEGKVQGAHISFATVELLWQTLTKKRWEILQAMTGLGVISMREAARLVGRDVKAVHGDLTVLIQAGVVNRTENGINFPYDAVHVDFTLTSSNGTKAA
jgi:predicted transcriptional regulator